MFYMRDKQKSILFKLFISPFFCCLQLSLTLIIQTNTERNEYKFTKRHFIQKKEWEVQMLSVLKRWHVQGMPRVCVAEEKGWKWAGNSHSRVD